MNNKSPYSLKALHACLIVTASTALAPAAWAGNYCEPYSAVFRLEGSSPFGPLNGGGTYTIGANAPQPAQVAAVLNGSAGFDPTATEIETTFSSMALFEPGADGSINILTGIDKAKATVTGPGSFTSETKSRITGGSGLYEGMTGRATSTSVTVMDLTTGYTISDITVEGKICGFGEDDE